MKGAPDTAPRRSLPALLLLAGILAAGNCMLGVFSAVQELAKAELALSDTQLGLLQGLAMSLPMASLSIPVGIAVDRTKRVRLLLVASLCWTAGTFITALADSTAMLFAGRLIVGLGANFSTTIGISIAADLCLPEARGRSLLLLTIGKYGGSALAFALGGLLLGIFRVHSLYGYAPWRAVHLALGMASLVLTLAVPLLREPVRQEVAATTSAPFATIAAQLWSYRRFLAPLFLGQVGVLMADAAAMIWAAPVLSRRYGVGPEDFAGWMGLVILASGVLGALAGGFAADFGHRSGLRGGILFGAVIAAGLALPSALFPMAPSVAIFGIALFVFLLAGTITGLVTATTMAVILPNELRGLCVGAFIAFGGLIALGGGPTVVTMVSTLLGGEAHLAPALAIVGLVVSVAGFLGFFVAMRNVPEPIR